MNFRLRGRYEPEPFYRFLSQNARLPSGLGEARDAHRLQKAPKIGAFRSPLPLSTGRPQRTGSSGVP